MNIIDNTIFCAIGSNWWGSGETVDAAIKRVAREAKGWGSMCPKRFDVNVYCHEPDEYLHWDDSGVYLVDRVTDIIKARAIAAYAVKDIQPSRPLSSMRLLSAPHAYYKGQEAIEWIKAWNADGKAPIGDKVSA
jgi:hypothetical protein